MGDIGKERVRTHDNHGGNARGNGPALALLLAGPALSLPNMLVISGVMGWKKTAVFSTIIVILSTTAGIIYGMIWG